MRDVSRAGGASSACLGPSTNTIVQPDFEMMRPAPASPIITAGFFTPNAQAVSNDSFMAGTQVDRGEETRWMRLKSVMTCAPELSGDGDVCGGRSSVAPRAPTNFRPRLRKTAGGPISASARIPAPRPLKTYGRRQGGSRILSPYYSGRQSAGRKVFHRFRVRGGPRHLSPVQELDGDRRGCRPKWLREKLD